VYHTLNETIILRPKRRVPEVRQGICHREEGCKAPSSEKENAERPGLLCGNFVGLIERYSRRAGRQT